ncbi:MAG: sodium:calcium antiporter [Pseudomonadota bacterium]
MTVSLSAALKGSADISLGNIVGSNIANILLIIGFSAFIMPIVFAKISAMRDALVMIGASLLMIAVMFWGQFIWQSGIIMFACLIGYIIYAYMQDRKNNAGSDDEDIDPEIAEAKIYSPMIACGGCLVGFVGLIGGAHLLVEGAVSIARSFGISEAIIGLTLVAFGTSLPELATAIMASIKKHGDVVIGNIIGSCIFNILAILGITSMIVPINVVDQILNFDVWIMLASALWLWIMLHLKLTAHRIWGGGLLALYVGYYICLYYFF